MHQRRLLQPVEFLEEPARGSDDLSGFEVVFVGRDALREARVASESLGVWVARVHHARKRATLLSEAPMDEKLLLDRITCDPKIFGGKPIIRGHRLAVEHVLGMLAAGDTTETIVSGYPWMEREDVLACLAYARRVVGHERVEPFRGVERSVITEYADAVQEERAQRR